MSSNPLIRVAAVSFSFVVLCGLQGCTSTEAESTTLSTQRIIELGQEAEESGLLEQAAALKDGKVTSAEYESAFEDLSACLSEKGYPASKTWLSPVDGHTKLFEVGDAGHTLEVKQVEVQECIDAFWVPVSSVYQTVESIEMDESLRQASIECLQNKGYDLTGDEQTPEEMGGPEAITASGLSDRWNDTLSCVVEAQSELFPEIPTTAITHS